MTLKKQPARISLNISLLALFFISLFLNPISALAADNGGANLPAFADFSKTVQNGKTTDLRGVYISDVLALPVVQQPSSNAGYVSSRDGEVTQFAMASQYGNVGLLAHNHLSGKLFSQITVGQEVRLVYGDGKVETFVVTEVLKYQAMQPNSPYSEFRNINDDKTITAEQMFKRVYFGDRHVTFQTCIEKDGALSWGRLFIIAVPKVEPEHPGYYQ
ncbi:MAG: hypothetical protein QM730_12265 [Anaerolineales bacterium]